MQLITNFPALTILLSLLCSGVTFALRNKHAAKTLSLSLISVCLVFNALTLYYCAVNGSFTYIMGHFPAPWGNELRAGIIEACLCIIFDIVIILSIIGGQKELNTDIEDGKHKYFFVMTALVNASLSALVYTNDIFTGYVFIEICTIASTGLLMLKETGRTTLASIRYMVFSLLGSGLFLIGVILLYDITGHLLLENICESVGVIWQNGQYRIPLLVTIGLITVGLSIKSGLFPFHFWMPDTYGCATPAGSAILSGIVSKGYIFLLIKIIYRGIGEEVFYSSGIQDVLFVFDILAMVLCSIQAVSENDINKMTAFSSAAQIGYIFMGIGLDASLGIVAAIFHVFAHSLTKPMLFLANAKLTEVSGGSRKFADLRGAAHRNRAAGLAFTVGSLSMVGIPGFMGFISKLTFAQAALDNELRMVFTLAVLAISTILNTMYFLRTMLTIYASNDTEHGVDPKNRVRSVSQLGFAASTVFFVAVNILIGFCSQPVLTLIEQGLQQL